MQQRQMEAIIPPVEREQLRAELTPERKARDTKMCVPDTRRKELFS